MSNIDKGGNMKKKKLQNILLLLQLLTSAVLACTKKAQSQKQSLSDYVMKDSSQARMKDRGMEVRQEGGKTHIE